jgi:predicted MFS family arabinose efflux permease
MSSSAVADAPPLSKEQRSAFISALAGWVFDYYEVFLLTMLVVPISAELGLSTGQVAAVFSVQLFFMAVGGVGFGYLADRIGRRDVLMWTIVVYCIATMARAFVPNYAVLLILTAIASVGIGGEYGVGQTLVSELVPKNRRGWWSGLLYGGIYVGIMLAAIVGGHVTPHIGWRWTFIVSGIPVLVAIYIRKVAPESEVWEKQQQAGKKPDLSLLRRRIFIVPFLLCLGAGTLQFFGYYGITTFLPTYLAGQGFDAAKASWWLFFTGLAGIVGCLVGAYLSDHWGRRPTLSLLAATAAASGVVLFFTWDSLLTSAWIMIPFFFLYFGSNGATVFGALFSELFPTELRSTGVSAALQVARGLTAVPPLLSAFMLPRWGYESVVLLGAIWFLLLAGYAWVFKETRGISVVAVDREAHTAPAATGATVQESLAGSPVRTEA